MGKLSLSSIVAVVALGAMGCKGGPAAPPTTTPPAALPVLVGPTSTPGTAVLAPRIVVVGQVLTPPAGPGGALIGAGGSTIVAAGGGNAVANNGAGIVAAGGGNYRLAAGTPAPLANAEVFLADAGGNPIPNLPHALTDAQGRYTLADAPVGLTCVVAVSVRDAKGATGKLQTVVQIGERGATADVDGATTLVTAAIITGRSGTLGTFNPGTFAAAVQTTGRTLGAGEVPDWTSLASVIARMDRLIETVAELKTAIGELREAVAALAASVQNNKPPSPSANPTPAPTPAGPTAGPTTGPSPAATAAPSPTASASAGPSAGPTASPTPAPTATPTLPPLYGVVKNYLGAGSPGRNRSALQFDASGNLFIGTADASGSTLAGVIEHVAAGSTSPTVLAGRGTVGSAVDGPAATATLGQIAGIALVGSTPYWIDGHTVRRLVDGQVTTVAGSAGAYAHTDGVGVDARFDYPQSILAMRFGGADFLYVGEGNLAKDLRRVELATGRVTTVILDPPTSDQVFALAPDGGGGCYAAIGHRIAHLVPDATGSKATVTFLAGGAEAGYADGPGTTARFNRPQGLALRANGWLYVADQLNKRVRAIAPNGMVSTVAGGKVGEPTDGTGDSAIFRNPFDVEFGPDGRLFVTDNYTVKTIQ